MQHNTMAAMGETFALALLGGADVEVDDDEGPDTVGEEAGGVTEAPAAARV
jgi:hypothetical protein